MSFEYPHESKTINILILIIFPSHLILPNLNLWLWITQVLIINYVTFCIVLKLSRLNFGKIFSFIYVIMLGMDSDRHHFDCACSGIVAFLKIYQVKVKVLCKNSVCRPTFVVHFFFSKTIF